MARPQGAQACTATRWTHAEAVLEDLAGRVLAVVWQPALYLVGVGSGWALACAWLGRGAWWPR